MPTIAIVGASSNPRKFGNKGVRAYLRQGWKVIPVNPNEAVVEGLPTVPRLEDVTEPLDRISFYVPAEVGETLLTAVRNLSPKEFWLNPGAESESLLATAERLGLDPINACSIVDIGERP